MTKGKFRKAVLLNLVLYLVKSLVYLRGYLRGWPALSLDVKCTLQAACKCEGSSEASGIQSWPAALLGLSMSWGENCSTKKTVPGLMAVSQCSPLQPAKPNVRWKEPTSSLTVLSVCLQDLLERLQPNIKRCETFDEAVQAVAALEAAEAKAQAAGGFPPHVFWNAFQPPCRSFKAL